ncbi:MAG: PAS domain S-box protein, partial [Gemmatimonadota bacterium]
MPGSWLEVVVEIGRTEGRGERPPRAAPPSLEAGLLDQLTDAFLIADADGWCLEANLAAVKLLGYTRVELLSMSVTDLLGGVREHADATSPPLPSRDGHRRLVDLRRKDGSTVRVEARSSVLETPEGRWAISIVREAESDEEGRSTAAEKRLASIVQSSDDAIFSVTLDGLVDAWNPAAERLYGFRADDIIGRHIEITAPPERKDELAQNIARVSRGEHVRDLETVRLAEDGRRIDVSLTISPILDGDGRVSGMSTIARDITERKRAEQRTHTLHRL